MIAGSPLGIVRTIIGFYTTLIFVYVLMSWIPSSGSGIVDDIRHVLATICEPYLALFRRFVPPIGMIDISPIIAILVLQALSRLLGNL